MCLNYSFDFVNFFIVSPFNREIGLEIQKSQRPDLYYSITAFADYESSPVYLVLVMHFQYWLQLVQASLLEQPLVQEPLL